MILSKAGKLLRLLANGGYRQALTKGVAAAVEHEEALAAANIDTIVDIGANKGQFALVANRHWPDATLIAFEPIPAAATKFRAVFDGASNVMLHEFAIGDTAGTAELHLSGRQDSSSLLPIGELQETVFPGTAEVGTIEIPVRRLRDLVEDTAVAGEALLKLDVQGFELQALQGCAELLPRFRHVYVECSYIELYEGQALAADVAAYLGEQGFEQTGQFNLVTTADGTDVQADLWFSRAARD